jgi:adenylate cyclase
VIVAIDDESMNGWIDDKGRTQMMPDRWTWPRTVYGKAVENLKAAGAKVITFDMVFSESTRLDPQQDLEFGKACRKAGNVIIGYRFSESNDENMKRRKLETLIPPLADAVSDSGVVHVSLDRDSFIRRMPLTDDDDLLRPNLDLATLRQYLWGKRAPFEVDVNARQLAIGGRVFPLERHGESFNASVNFVGGPQSFPTYSFHHVYFQTMDLGVFKGKVVYIGSTSQILHDNFPTPFTGKELMPGVEIHANFLDTLLTGEFLKYPRPLVELLLILGLGILTSLATFRVKAWQGMMVMILELLVYLVAALILFLNGRLVIGMVAPMATIFVSFTGITAYRVVVEEKRAREIRNQFSRYVSRSIVDEILKDPSRISLGGQSKEVTILFSDVRGFTAMSEKMSPEQVVEILNEYLSAMVDVVIENDGTIDKYVGDAIMAIWGSPLPDPRHRQKAVTTAVRMMERLQGLRAKWVAEGKAPMDIGIGLNSGTVVAGNMGHLKFKMDYTVIGDEVNLAARLESANKEVLSHVLISGSTYEGCRDLVEVVAHPPVMVKGKEKPVEIYEVIGWKGKGRADWAVPLAH